MIFTLLADTQDPVTSSENAIGAIVVMIVAGIIVSYILGNSSNHTSRELPPTFQPFEPALPSEAPVEPPSNSESGCTEVVIDVVKAVVIKAPQDSQESWKGDGVGRSSQ